MLQYRKSDFGPIVVKVLQYGKPDFGPIVVVRCYNIESLTLDP